MIAKRLIVATAILLGASSAALAQSAWTTGTAVDRAAAGYALPYGAGLYAYDPDFLSGHAYGRNVFAVIPHQQASVDDPLLTGGGSRGYNEFVRRDW